MRTDQARYSPAQLARMLGAQEPTAEQAAVIGAPLAPMAVIAGAGSGKSETMAARLVWLVANQFVRPERVRARLTGLRRAGLVLPDARALAAAGALQPADEDLLAGDPVISTYHAYA